jgi:hypothetical protein
MTAITRLYLFAFLSERTLLNERKDGTPLVRETSATRQHKNREEIRCQPKIKLSFAGTQRKS